MSSFIRKILPGLGLFALLVPSFAFSDPWWTRSRHGISQQSIYVFGPVTSFSAQGSPQGRTLNFAVSDTEARYVVHVHNNAARSVTLELNGKTLFHDMKFKKKRDDLHRKVKLQAYNTLRVRASGESASSVTVTVTTNDADLPPPPETVAPPLSPVAGSESLADSTAFLYSGTHPVQTGVEPGTIRSQQVAILRGRVMDREQSPIPGVTIQVLNHPEFGQTLSRADGQYDFAVNGGTQLILTFQKSGYLGSQRQLHAPAQDFRVVSDVSLVKLDPRVTPVSFGSSAAIQVAQASPVSDASGSRQATLIIPSGTEAALEFEGGGSLTANEFHIRATEYTVGPHGPQAMPAILPASSSYTYAVELSADEAMALGATRIRFSRPIYQYLDNFIGLPVGATVPLGYYDKTQGNWVALKNGRVIRVLGASGGLAEIDIQGQGLPASETELSSLGFTREERQKLTALYPASKTLWRMPIPHFSIIDANLSSSGPPSNAGPVPGSNTDGNQSGNGVTGCGSIIDIQSQVLRESLPITGTPYSLNYASQRGAERIARYRLDIPLSGTDIAGVSEIYLQIDLAGRRFSYAFPPSANLRYAFTWDGKDAYGRQTFGSRLATISIGYEGDSNYTVPAEEEESFGIATPTSFPTPVPARALPVRHMVYTLPIGVWSAAGVGLGSWTLSSHHAYDPISRTLHLGDGTERSTYGTDQLLSKFAGTGVNATTGDGGPALHASFSFPSGLAVGADGDLYVGDGDRIRRIDLSTGVIDRFAGGGSSTEEGAHRLAARFSFVSALAFGPGGILYVADQDRGKVYAITQDGEVRSVGGSELPQIRGLAAGPDGTLYLSNDLAGVQRLGTSGTRYLIPETASVGAWNSLAVSPDGSALYGSASGKLWRLALQDNSLREIADPSQNIGGVTRVGIDRSGSVVFFTFDGRLYQVVNDKILLIPLLQPISGGWAIAVGQDDTIYISENGPRIIEQVKPPYPGAFASSNFQIASADGTEIYEFSPRGRHLSTRDALTNALRREFGYDARGLLRSVTDGSGNVTSIERDSQGKLLGIRSPFGAMTSLTTDLLGRLEGIANPAGEAHRVTYHSTGGLLETLSRPSGGQSAFVFDELGRLSIDQDPLGGLQILARSERNATSYDIRHSSAMGVTTAYELDFDPIGNQTERRSYSDGSTALLSFLASLRQSERVLPDQTREISRHAADPRFGLQAPYQSVFFRTTPLGLSSKLEVSKSIAYAEPEQFEGSPFTLTTTSNLNGNVATSSFDNLTRILSEVSSQGVRKSTHLDELGRPARIQTGALTPVDLTYDERGRLSTLSQGARLTRYGYDPFGNLASVENPLGQKNLYQYDLAGRVITQTLPDLRVIRYTYDTNGNRTSVSPPGRPAHGFTYSLMDLMLSYLPPLVGEEPSATRYEYDLDRRLTRRINPDGTSIQYVYDPVSGKISSQITPDITVRYSYHPATGQLSSFEMIPVGSVTPSRTVSYGYDGFLETRVTMTGLVSGSYTVAYDNNFLGIRKAVRMGGIERAAQIFQYDSDQRLITAGSQSLTYGPASGLLEQTKLVGSQGGVPSAITIQDDYGHNTFGEVTSSVTKKGSEPLLSQSFTRDTLGRISEKSETVLGEARSYRYGYDPAGRLTQVTRDGTAVFEYAYDPNGNRLEKKTSAGSVSGSYDEQDRVVRYGNFTYTFDVNGQIKTKTDVSSGGETRYRFTVGGRLLEVTLPSGTNIQYVVDAIGKRIGKTKNGQFIEGFIFQDDLRPIGWIDSTRQPKALFTYATKAHVPDQMLLAADLTVYRIVSDERGSVRLVINTATGELAQRMEYDEFGNVVLDTNPGFQPFGFAGGVYDLDTGLTHFGARDYDPVLGRWLSRDPIGFDGGDTNLYEYVLNDPINFTDPKGTNGAAVGACVAVAVLVYVAGKYVTEIRNQCQSDINDVLKDPKNPNPPPYNGDVNRCTWDRATNPLGDLGN